MTRRVAMQSRGSRRSQSGLTIVEVMISFVVLAPLIIAIMLTRNVVTKAASTEQRRADVNDDLRRVARHVRRIALPGLKSTVGTRAMQRDIDAAVAAESTRQVEDPSADPIPIPKLGQWIAPDELDPRSSLRFQGANGLKSMNASAPVTQSLEFQMDEGETDNDVDDDGDGFIDEGKLNYEVYGSSQVLMDGVEQCSFTIDNGTLVFTLQAACLDNRGNVLRAFTRQQIAFRNN